MKKKQIKTMLELERILNDYLAHNKPLALLEEEYILTYKQRAFYINRVLAYETNYDKIKDQLGNIENINPGEEYLFMNHFIEEKYPLEHEQQISYFKRLAYLKEKLMFSSDEETLFDQDKKIIELKKQLLDFDESEISLARSINLEISAALEDEVTDLDQESLEEKIRLKYKLTSEEFEKLNDLYEVYNFIVSKINRRKTELKLNNSDEHYQKLEEEYESIRTELVHRNIKLANWVVRKFFKYIPFEMEEAQAYALEGLVQAINKFDYTRGNHFSTFATLLIRHNITRHFKDITGMTWNTFLKCIDYERYIEQYKAIDPSKKHVTVEDIYNSGISGLSYGELKNIDNLAVRSILPNTYVYPMDPLDQRTYKSDFLKTFDDYEEEDEFIDEVEMPMLATENIMSDDDPELVTENIAITSTAREAIFSVLNNLNERERNVLIMRYGLEGNSPMTLDQIGAYYNRRKETIRQIEKKALRKLRHPHLAKKIKGYLGDDYFNENVSKKKTIGEYILEMFNYEIKNSDNPAYMNGYEFRNLFNIPYSIDTSKIQDKYLRACELIEEFLYLEDPFIITNRVNNIINEEIPTEFVFRYIRNYREKNRNRRMY